MNRRPFVMSKELTHFMLQQQGRAGDHLRKNFGNKAMKKMEPAPRKKKKHDPS